MKPSCTTVGAGSSDEKHTVVGSLGDIPTVMSQLQDRHTTGTWVYERCVDVLLAAFGSVWMTARCGRLCVSRPPRPMPFVGQA